MPLRAASRAPRGEGNRSRCSSPPRRTSTAGSTSLVDGGTAAVRWTTHATITGAPVQTPLGPVEPRGQKTQLSGVNIIRTRGSQIAEEWIYWDQVSWLQELGAISKPSG
jgi:SnoaL-like polyketide cyclase